MNKKKLKILFLFTHLHKAGMQRAVSNISQALPKEFEQYVGFFGTEEPPFRYNATLHDFCIPGSNSSGFFSKLKNFLSRLYKLRQFIREHEIDTVVSFGESANLINTLSFTKVKRILSIRVALGVYDRASVYNFFYKSLITWTYPFADMIVTCSEGLRDQVKRLIDNKIPVYHIPNLYHIGDIRALADEPLSLESEEFTNSRFILNIGSIQPRKGQTLLIEAFNSISESFPDLKLLLIGEGPDSESCHRLIGEFDLQDRVMIIPFDSNPYRYMKRASAFILASAAEGFPNVLVEAMACGCPVVAFDCPTGPKEILGESVYGELIPQLSVKDLADRVQELLGSNERQEWLRCQSQKRAQDFDAKFVSSKWVKVLMSDIKG